MADLGDSSLFVSGLTVGPGDPLVDDSSNDGCFGCGRVMNSRMHYIKGQMLPLFMALV